MSRPSTPIPNFTKAVCFVTDAIPNINTTQLVKTLYFLELEYQIKFGEQLLEPDIIRDEMGPVPANYKSYLERLQREGHISIVNSGMSTRYTCKSEYDFTEIEYDVLRPVIERVIEIRNTRKGTATEIIKKLSYMTEPMVRFLKDEEKTGKIKRFNRIMRWPFFDKEKDVDPLAAYRRAYRDHLRKAAKYSFEDAMISLECMEDFKPFLAATNEHSR